MASLLGAGERVAPAAVVWAVILVAALLPVTAETPPEVIQFPEETWGSAEGAGHIPAAGR
jgi:hypothetical protein